MVRQTDLNFILALIAEDDLSLTEQLEEGDLLLQSVTLLSIF